MVKDALAGIRVVDFTWAAAGPFCTTVLALLGAEVIKIETSKRMDGTRVRPGPGKAFVNANASPPFNDLNVNKMSVALDLTKPEAVELVKGMVAVSDIVAENFRPGVLSKLGLGYQVLKKIKPDIVMLSSSASGQTGPDGGYLGYASIFGALSGLGYVTGYRGGPPMELRLPMDLTSAMTSTFVVLAALDYRRRSGVGQHLDVSSREALSCYIGEILMDAAVNHRSQERTGNENAIMAPHNCYPCAGDDEWISIAVGSDEEWRALCRAMDNPSWTSDEKFADALSRWKNRDALDKLVGEWSRPRAKYDVMHKLQRVGVAAFPSMNAKDIFTDPHLKARRFAEGIDHPVTGKQTLVGPPFKLSATPARIRRHAPLLGEHNERVFGDLLGMSRDDMERLVVEGVFV
ncbi:MAG: CoA transferase [Chloroflexi bacterium]|nr:CoA transferase [Chloroflexota bacterium]